MVFAVLMSTNAVSLAAHRTNDACQILSSSKQVKKIAPHSSQIIVVKSLGGIKAKMTLCQRHGALWKSKVTSSYPAVIGKNGMALLGTKKEGDLKTPAGLYPIGEAFGTQPLALKMDYKYITADDKFIDDVNHKRYNTWVSGATDANSYESMFIEPYTYGAVINYNMSPIKKGAGSAIFMHLWRSPNSPTAGCIAVEKKHMLTILHWLDKAQHPYILVH
ncbi:L,D-transpeptidase family protein [Legionella sp. 27fs60]|uniref:L,D-transpeptidase family protein n=2 Tax=Legionella bononiensis TaxID=2793102 RepID=A0ABS1WB89_9GAMM|nr:L,D-transpeptidase family protein [Legionella bononiensis]MBL7526621.1 L,D-transpeptidase family protein [Legionella bononiensis]